MVPKSGDRFSDKTMLNAKAARGNRTIPMEKGP
jgi:hypothetical protein